MEGKILKAIEALNGKFDNLAKDVSVIKDDICGMKTEISGMKTEMGTMKDEINTIKTDISEIKCKVDAISEQTAILTEFRTETMQRFELIESSIEVLGKENFNNKIELVEIKKRIAK